MSGLCRRISQCVRITCTYVQISWNYLRIFWHWIIAKVFCCCRKKVYLLDPYSTKSTEEFSFQFRGRVHSCIYVQHVESKEDCIKNYPRVLLLQKMHDRCDDELEAAQKLVNSDSDNFQRSVLIYLHVETHKNFLPSLPTAQRLRTNHNFDRVLDFGLVDNSLERCPVNGKRNSMDEFNDFVFRCYRNK